MPVGRRLGRQYVTGRVLAWIDVVQRPIYQQFAQLNDLLNTKCNMSRRSLKVECQDVDHRVGRGQAFAEVGEQTFSVDAVDDGEELTRWPIGFGVGFLRLQIEIQRPIGGLLDFLWIEAVGAGVRLRRVGCDLEHDGTPVPD